MAEIFINYRKNQALSDAQHFASLLTSDFGKHRVFIAVRNIKGFTDWRGRLQRQVQSCKVLIALIGPDWIEALDKKEYRPNERTEDFVRIEIAEALQRNIPVLPVMLNATPVPEKDKLPLEIRRMFDLQAMALRCDHFPEDTAAITQALKQILNDTRSQSGLSVSKVAMFMAATLAFGVFTGPYILTQLNLHLPGIAHNSTETVNQELALALRLLAEKEIFIENLTKKLKEAEDKRNDTQTKLKEFEAKIRDKQQEIQRLETALLNEKTQSANAAKKNEVLTYQIEAQKRAISEMRDSLEELNDQIQSKDQKIALLNSQIDESTSSLPISETVIQAPLQTLKGHSGWVHAASFSPDGRYLLSGSWDTTLKIWDWKSGQEKLTLKGHSNSIEDAAFSPDGRLILSASTDKTLKLWDLKEEAEISTLKGHWHGVQAAAFSPDSRFIFSGGKDNRLIIWNALTDRKRGELKGHSKPITAAAFSPDGLLLLSASEDKTIKLWNFDSGSEINTLKGHSGTVNTASFSPDGRYIVSGSSDKTLKIWDTNSGREIATLTGHKGAIYSAAFSPDRRYLVSGSEDQTLKLWHVLTGKLLATMNGHSAPVHVVTFSPDGRMIVSGSNDFTLKLWDVSKWTGAEQR